MTQVNKNINKLLKSFMEYKGFNQKQLGNFLGISEAQISRKLNQERNYTIDEIILIANKLNFKIDRLIGRRYNERNRKWEFKK